MQEFTGVANCIDTTARVSIAKHCHTYTSKDLDPWPMAKWTFPNHKKKQEGDLKYRNRRGNKA